MLQYEPATKQIEKGFQVQSAPYHTTTSNVFWHAKEQSQSPEEGNRKK